MEEGLGVTEGWRVHTPERCPEARGVQLHSNLGWQKQPSSQSELRARSAVPNVLAFYLLSLKSEQMLPKSGIVSPPMGFSRRCFLHWLMNEGWWKRLLTTARSRVIYWDNLFVLLKFSLSHWYMHAMPRLYFFASEIFLQGRKQRWLRLRNAGDLEGRTGSGLRLGTSSTQGHPRSWKRNSWQPCD